MKLNEYQLAACALDAFPKNYKGDVAALLGIGGEAGEVLEIEKKKIRDNTQYEIAQKEKFDELGDVLFYIAIYAGRCGFDLEDIARHNIKKCEAKSAVLAMNKQAEETNEQNRERID